MRARRKGPWPERDASVGPHQYIALWNPYSADQLGSATLQDFSNLASNDEKRLKSFKSANA